MYNVFSDFVILAPASSPDNLEVLFSDTKAYITWESPKKLIYQSKFLLFFYSFIFSNLDLQFLKGTKICYIFCYIEKAFSIRDRIFIDSVEIGINTVC